jgi:hypothetical protein
MQATEIMPWHPKLGLWAIHPLVVTWVERGEFSCPSLGLGVQIHSGKSVLGARMTNLLFAAVSFAKIETKVN